MPRLKLPIQIDFTRGAWFRFPGDASGKLFPVHDTVAKTWRHLNFWQYKTYIHGRVPRVKNSEGKISMVDVPWARSGSGFTLMFEAILLQLFIDTPVNAVAELMNEHDTRLWRAIAHWVDKAYEQADYANVTAIGIDEKSKKGHNHISVVVDLDEKRLINVQDGKDSTTVEKFKVDFVVRKGDSERIEVVTTDILLGFKRAFRSTCLMRRPCWTCYTSTWRTAFGRLFRTFTTRASLGMKLRPVSFGLAAGWCEVVLTRGSGLQKR